MKSARRRRVDVNLEELDRVLDGARQAPLSEADYDKLKERLHALAAMLVRPRNYGEDQRRGGGSRRLGNWRRDCSRIPTRPRHPDTAATEPRRLAARGRSRSRTRS